MRFVHLLLIGGALLGTPADAGEFFAEALYWKATEPVDWVLDTNRNPLDQYVNYQSVTYDFAPGFRIGGSHDGAWTTKFAYTHFETNSSDAASGDLTAAFLGGKEAQPPAPQLYFQTGQIAASINYNIFDLDFGKRYQPTDSLAVRPVAGVRGGWIHQQFVSGLQASYLDGNSPVQTQVTETMRNNFWGIGPKVGVEADWSLWDADELQVTGFTNFYAALLAGQWEISDRTDITTIEHGQSANSTKYIEVPNRDFGTATFQAIIGIRAKYRHWSAAVGYELNDWLNQCQIFDDATGPHNNDLILQGLTLQAGYEF